MTRTNRSMIVALAVLLSGIMTSCGGGSGSIDDKLTLAAGVWEGFAKETGISSEIKPFATDDRIFAAAYTENQLPTSGDCTSWENFVAGRLTFYEYAKEKFLEMQSIEIIDKYVDELVSGDIKNDSTIEVMIVSSCMKSQKVSAFELVDESWSLVPNLSASTYSNGMLMSIGLDCTPSCADGGVSYTKIEWSGSQFVEAGFVTSDGKPVNLSVDGTCPSYKTATSLPLAMCDQGTLVEQYIALARNIDDDSKLVNFGSLGDRFTPELARWTVQYRYLHGLSPSPTADEDFFENLGVYWHPDELTDNWRVFPSYCSSGSLYHCETYSYLFPTNECPSYRDAVYEFPLRRCDFGGWVFMLLNGLEDFDGKKPTDDRGAGLFDKETEERLRQFQKQKNLEVDGLAGPNTWRAMFGGATVDTGDSNGDRLYGPGDILPD